MSVSKPRHPFRVSSDQAMGVFGVCLATASAAFGIGMTVHGPMVSAGGKDFTVFAQLGPRRINGDASRMNADQARTDAGELDMTATASIPPRERALAAGSDAKVIPSVTLEAVGSDSATIALEGTTRLVRVGDIVPGAGEIIAILPGARPVLKTSQGLIVPAGD